MTYYVNYIKDRLGNNYLGIKIPNETVEPYLDQLKEYIGEGDFETFTKNQQLRDSSQYHITVINVADYNRCLSEIGIDKFVNSLDEAVFKYEIDDLSFKGIGTATSGTNRSFFVVCNSNKLQAIRNRFGLPEIDLHITIGFDKKDVHGVRKNQVIKKGQKFLKLLAQEYYKTENWNFIRNIENFSNDKNLEIIPVEITDSKLKVKCGGHYLEIIYLEEGEKFWIGTVYSIDENKPRLPETEIANILNKKEYE